ncbi:MAG: hypothetical protein IT204_22195 [Fimbriimonadaceae bacterium]|nr:hypothetical protein [Fimbriimonadaceae bacterium]
MVCGLAAGVTGLAGCCSSRGLTGNVDGFPQGGAAYAPAGWSRNELGLLTARMALVTAVSYTHTGDYDTTGLFQYFLGGYTPTLRGRFAGRQYLAHFIGRAQAARDWLPFDGVPGTYQVDAPVWDDDYWATGTTVITDLGGGEVHVLETLQITGPGEANYTITTEIRHGANYAVSQRVLGSEEICGCWDRLLDLLGWSGA